MECNKNLPVSQKIIKQLHHCGHHLHYKMGGRAGRRRILGILMDHEEMLQKELQEILGVQSGSLSEIIIKMEADGLVEKGKSRSDARNMILKLTQSGIVQAVQSKEEYDMQVAYMMSCFSEEQMEELHQLLGIMLGHWIEIENNE